MSHNEYYTYPETVSDILGDGIGNLVNSLIDFNVDAYDLPKLLTSDRKMGDDYNFVVNVTGTGKNYQTQTQVISYTAALNQSTPMNITLTNLKPIYDQYLNAAGEPEEDNSTVSLANTTWSFYSAEWGGNMGTITFNSGGSCSQETEGYTFNGNYTLSNNNVKIEVSAYMPPVDGDTGFTVSFTYDGQIIDNMISGSGIYKADQATGTFNFSATKIN